MSKRLEVWWCKMSGAGLISVFSCIKGYEKDRPTAKRKLDAGVTKQFA